MAGVFSTVRESFSSRLWSNDGQSEAFGIFKRSSSVSVNDFKTESSKAAPQLKRQRTMSFSMGCCLCGKKSLVNGEVQPPGSDFLFCGSGHTVDRKEGDSGYLSWWQVSWRLLGSRRKVSTWAENAGPSHDAYYRAPPRWKQLLRRLRAETRKMNCTQQSPGFHYDPLSYAKNFDDGCWKQCDSHARGFFPQMRFSASLVLENEALKSQLTGGSRSLNCPKSIVWREPASAQPNSSIWLRRKPSQPPSLDLKMVRVWRPAQRMA